MELVVQNLAKIKQAQLQFDGITVIAGNNNTGKSTIGKVLFGIFNAFKDIQGKIEQERNDAIVHAIRNVEMGYFYEKENKPLTNLSRFYSVKIPNLLAKSDPIDLDDEIRAELLNNKVPDEDVDKLMKDINARISSINEIEDNRIKKELISTQLRGIFNGQINSCMHKDTAAVVQLTIKGKSITVTFKDNNCEDFSQEFNLMHNAFYIDNPFIIDQINAMARIFRTNRTESPDDHLLNALSRNNNEGDFIAKLSVEDRLKEVINKIDMVIPGSIGFNNAHEMVLQDNQFTDALKIDNLSAGMKSFAILKLLIENLSIKEKDILILDEPEIHLHPQWQMIYAEIIVLLQKEFQLTVLLTTHSPYFLDAIELYSLKHGTNDKVHYYLSEMENEQVEFEDVTNHIDKIFAQLSNPIQELENLRNSLKN